mgnify:FL=1
MIGALYELRELDELEADRPRRSKGLSAVEGRGRGEPAWGSCCGGQETENGATSALFRRNTTVMAIKRCRIARRFFELSHS